MIGAEWNRAITADMRVQIFIDGRVVNNRRQPPDGLLLRLEQPARPDVRPRHRRGVLPRPGGRGGGDPVRSRGLPGGLVPPERLGEQRRGVPRLAPRSEGCLFRPDRDTDRIGPLPRRRLGGLPVHRADALGPRRLRRGHLADDAALGGAAVLAGAGRPVRGDIADLVRVQTGYHLGDGRAATASQVSPTIVASAA